MQATLERRDGSVIETATGTEEAIRARFAEVGAYCMTWTAEEETGKPDTPIPPGSDPEPEETGQPFGYLPEWLQDSADLMTDGDAWRTLYALGVNPGWSEARQRGLLVVLKSEGGTWNKPEADVLACVAMLNYRGVHKRTGKPLTSRSAEIKHSLKEQLVEWLEEEPGERKFDSPYSPRQWAKCMRTKWNAYGALRSRGQRIAYWVHRMLEAGGEMWPEKCGDLVPITK